MLWTGRKHEQCHALFFYQKKFYPEEARGRRNSSIYEAAGIRYSFKE